MAVLPIRTVPDPVLRTRCTPVPDDRFGTEALRQLIDSMLETMRDVEGVGLAGPQVGISQQIFVFELEGRTGHVINPTLEVLGARVHEPSEGCLSVPGLYYGAPRAEEATVTGVDWQGEPVSYSGTGLFARMLQHEFDHLDGLLFVDRLEGDDRKAARRAMSSAEFARQTRQTHTDRSGSISTSFGQGKAGSSFGG